MEDAVKVQKKIIKIDLILLLILIILSFILSDNPMPWVKGFTFGGLIGILNFMLLGKTIERAVTMPPSKAQSYASINYFIRLFIVGVVVVLGFRADYLNGIAVIIGLLIIKQVILFSQLFSDKKFYQRILKRKEDN